MSRTITNFGKNISFTPQHYYEPKDEAEVLAILDAHKGESIRTVASGHAWSSAIETDGVILNIAHLNDVAVCEGSRPVAHAGGGATLQHVLNAVQGGSAYTLPTLGGIRKQTIAGATSTGTHGSGRPSLSHYLREVRIAGYDSETGRAKIFTYTNGDALRAARCALGCMGVVVSVDIELVPKYLVAEEITEQVSLADCCAVAAPDRLEQFIVMPYSWRWFLYERRIAAPDEKLGRIRVYYNRLRELLLVDVFLHILVSSMARLVERGIGGARLVRWFYVRFLPAAMPVGARQMDESEEALTIAHDLFVHIEMEGFVPQSRIEDVYTTVRYLVEVCAGFEPDMPAEAKRIRELGRDTELEALRGSYAQHYPIYFRRLPSADDTLISMTSGIAEPHYSISFFTYFTEGHRTPYYAFCALVARVLTEAYGVRFHWGKFNPLAHDDIAHLFPNLPRFREICAEVDPNGVFQNEYTRRILGFA